MSESTKIPAAQNSIEDPNAESAKNLAAQKDQSPTFDQLSADLQSLISQLTSFIELPSVYQSIFPDVAQILETFCSPNENAEKGEPMTVSDAYWKIYALL